MITQQRLKELLHYDPKSGVFRRKVIIHGPGKVGDIAGHVQKNGVRQINVDGKSYLAHRLAHLYIYGAFPVNGIRHHNQVRGHNRLDNLVLTTPKMSQKSKLLYKNNSSGFCGVCWDKHAKKWSASITVDGKNTKLGRFKVKADAIAARAAANIRHGYTDNHGRSRQEANTALLTSFRC